MFTQCRKDVIPTVSCVCFETYNWRSNLLYHASFLCSGQLSTVFKKRQGDVLINSPIVSNLLK